MSNEIMKIVAYVSVGLLIVACWAIIILGGL